MYAMYKEYLKTAGSAVAAWALKEGAAVWTALVSIIVKLWAFCRWIGRGCKGFVLWVAVPKGDTPFDGLKHYLSVLFFFMGVTALLWSAKQILYPPLVITVAELPDPLKREYWVNPELARTLIGQVERIRNTVKGERDPTFEAVLNPPNIVIKTGDGWSLDVQQQILTPLGSLLGRGQGEVHLSLTCYHPGCARASDEECNEPVLQPKNPDEKAVKKQYLCLRLTADIFRGKVYRRLTPRLVLGNDNADLTEPMARVAEAVTAVSDPATAALYFYRRMREERAASTTFTNVPDIVAELFNEASKAAEQAESNDAVSACWAHSVRAHLAIDRREFEIAEVFLKRARAIAWWKHLTQLTLPVDCDRLITIAEMEFARQLSRQPEDPEFSSSYEFDKEGRRVRAAYERIDEVIAEFDDSFATLRDFISRSASSRDVKAALELARSEIGLNFFTPPEQCTLITTRVRPPSFQSDPDIDGVSDATGGDEAKRKDLKNQAWDNIRTSIESIEKPKDEVLLPLTRQASLDFLQQYALNTPCAENVVALADKIFVRHANDPNVVQLLVSVTETAALKKTEMLNRPVTPDDRKNPQLESLHRIYQRIVDTGADRTGAAINKLAYLAEAIKVDGGEERLLKPGEKRLEPSPETLQNLIRAWRRYQRDRFPADTRPQAEYALAFWGSVLMRSYPAEFHTIKQSNLKEFQTQLEKDKNGNKDQLEALPGFLTNASEYQTALRALYPKMQADTLSSLPKLPDIGARIGCMCMLSYVTLQNELADFFILRLNRWQRQAKLELPMCRRDLIPRLQVVLPPGLRTREVIAGIRFRSAQRAFSAAPEKSEQLKQSLARADEARKAAQKAVRDEIASQRATIREWIEEKRATIAKAEELCYMARLEKPAEQSPESTNAPSVTPAPSSQSGKP